MRVGIGIACATWVVCGCTTAEAPPDGASTCERGDGLVGTWVDESEEAVWRIGDDCTWGLVQRSRKLGGIWLTAGGQAIFTPSDPTPTLTVTPVVLGDRLVVSEATGGQWLPTGGGTPLLSGGPGFSDTVWGSDTTTPDQGGSCSVFELHTRLMLHAGGSAHSEFRGQCLPARMPYEASRTGTWTAVDDMTVSTELIDDRNPANQVTQTWLRYGDHITTSFFVRVP